MLAVIAELERRRLTGIGGWLLFYVVLSVLSGILTLLSLCGPLDSLSFFLSVSIIITLIAGLVLIFQRKRLAVKVNILCEVLNIVYNLWCITYIDDFALIMLVIGQGYVDMLIWMLLFGGMIAIFVIISILWIIYFLKSRRVKYTLVR